MRIQILILGFKGLMLYCFEEIRLNIYPTGDRALQSGKRQKKISQYTLLKLKIDSLDQCHKFNGGVVYTVNPLLTPPGGLFFSSTFEGGLNSEGGLKREGGLI